MMRDDVELFARYDRLQSWVEREQFDDTGARPFQTYLRRSRLCADIERMDFEELLRELREFGDTES